MCNIAMHHRNLIQSVITLATSASTPVENTRFPNSGKPSENMFLPSVGRKTMNIGRFKLAGARAPCQCNVSGLRNQRLACHNHRVTMALVIHLRLFCYTSGYHEAQDNGSLVFEGTNIKNFNAAKHRAESTRTPLGRMVLFFDATLATAVGIYKERRVMDKPGRAAHRFLSYIDSESLVQLAMMADSSDKHMGLLRFHDNEAFDEAVSPQAVETFLDRVLVR